MSPTSPISFHFIAKDFTLKERKHLKAFILDLFKKEGKAVETINYIFCTDDYLLELNKSYLKHFTLTDIITFELSEKTEAAISDIFISIDRVKENAKTFQIPFTKELLRVIFHGALHLCGYKDKTKADKQAMRNKEDFYLNLYAVSRGTL
jgi:probable rRNA maturation factor